jgi:hypothetical protein
LVHASLFILTLDSVAAVTPSALLVWTDGTIQMKGHAFHPPPLLFRDQGVQNIIASRSSATSMFAIFGLYTDQRSQSLAFFVSIKLDDNEWVEEINTHPTQSSNHPNAE